MIEAGEVRPSEDILLLLISHFGVADHDAVRLWELAKYDSDLPDQFKPDIEQLSGNKVVMLMAMDMRVMYSDGLNIQTSGGGLTLNFTQASSQGAPMPIARVGMSSEQAEQVLVELGKAILRLRYSGGKHQLPPRT